MKSSHPLSFAIAALLNSGAALATASESVNETAANADWLQDVSIYLDDQSAQIPGRKYRLREDEERISHLRTPMEQ
jgi:hypothetical protein